MNKMNKMNEHYLRRMLKLCVEDRKVLEARMTCYNEQQTRREIKTNYDSMLSYKTALRLVSDTEHFNTVYDIIVKELNNKEWFINALDGHNTYDNIIILKSMDKISNVLGVSLGLAGHIIDSITGQEGFIIRRDVIDAILSYNNYP